MSQITSGQMLQVNSRLRNQITIAHAGFPKFAGHAGHVRRILKMSGEELLDRRTKCLAWENVLRWKLCSPVILSLKMSGERLKCPAKNLGHAGHFVRRVTKSFREACTRQCFFNLNILGGGGVSGHFKIEKKNE